MTGGFRSSRTWAGWAFALVVCALPNLLIAGGGPENVLLIINPDNADSLYVGNYYKTARNIPDRNVIYMTPEASDYIDFTSFQLPALLGTLANRGIDEHIDYIIIPPGGDFFVPIASDLINDFGCQANGLRRLSISSAYTLAFIPDAIFSGTLSVFEANRYAADTDAPVAFDSSTAWDDGVPSESASARRYFIGFMLGYDGQRGNTLDEIIALIDRSVAADDTHPTGTVYYMKTPDTTRSEPRDPHFPAAIAAIQSLGGQAEQIDGEVLPIGNHDCLGIMTGAATPQINDADLTILPGAFCDHLTSFAATFNTSSQTKLSEWITRGASGSMGTVEEPCVFGKGIPGKFPHPRFHVWYAKGLSLGESLFRSIEWAPFQGLFYGDPLTRPFAYIPSVSVNDAPVGEVSGTVTLTPTATTTAPGGSIASFELLIDGRFHGATPPGSSFSIDTTKLADGAHELRVIAFEDSDVRTQGRWISQLLVNNSARSVTVTITPQPADEATVLSVVVVASGGDVAEMRLLHNGRVLAATTQAAATFPIAARTLGAGEVRLTAAADFTDGKRARSPIATVNIDRLALDARQAVPNAQAPVAHSYTMDALAGGSVLLDLPATDGDGDPLVTTVTSQPAQASVTPGANAFLLTVDPDATGSDTISFEATDGAGVSNVATVTLKYCARPTIVEQPAVAATCVGESAVFTVDAIGGDLAYQWFRDGTPIPGATSATLIVENVQLDHTSVYAVDVSNVCGDLRSTVRSDSVGVFAQQSVAVTSQPEGAELCAGDDWTVFALASGANEFQWFKNGDPVPGATSFFFLANDLTIADGGAYTVEASNDCGTVTSAPAILIVTGCGDADFDADVDMADFAGFQICRTPSGSTALPTGCDPYDFDADFDIDLDDYTSFQDVVTEP
jgi:Bacterial Ig domain